MVVSMSADRQAVRLPVLDGLRGLAALIVVLGHASYQEMMPSLLRGKGVAQMGVVLFFLLSGFLMTYLYAGTPLSVGRISAYARHRFGRVLPLYVLVVVLSFVTYKFVVPVAIFDVFSIEDLLGHLLIIKANGVLWTVPVEIQFYLVFVAIWYAESRGVSLPVIAVLAVLCVLAAYLSGSYGRNFLLARWGHFFLLGSLTGLLWRRHRQQMLTISTLPMVRWSSWVIVILALLALPQLRQWVGCSVFPAIIDPFFAGLPLLFFLAALLNLPAAGFLKIRFMCWLGKISYGIYIFHVPVLRLVRRGFQSIGIAPGVYLFPLAFALVLQVAWVSYRYFETPMRIGISGKSRGAREGGLASNGG